MDSKERISNEAADADPNRTRNSAVTGETVPESDVAGDTGRGTLGSASGDKGALGGAGERDPATGASIPGREDDDTEQA